MSGDNKYRELYSYGEETQSAPDSVRRRRAARARRRRGRRENGKPKRRRRIPLRKILIALLIIGLVCFVTGCIAVYSIIKDTPEINPESFYELLSENSTIYDQNGEKVEDLRPQTGGLRENIPYAQIPKDLQNAFIALEDKTFWKHHGFNFTRLAGAVIQGIKTGDISGTSTITQQLARNLYLDYKKTITRKVKEAYYTVEIEKKLSKEQILEAYLNTINFGFGTYGVQAAAQAYFGKDVSELTVAECAALASIPQQPTNYELVKRYHTSGLEGVAEEDILQRGDQYTLVYNDTFKSRQEMGLKFMLENQFISQNQYNEAMAEDIRDGLDPALETADSSISSYFSDYVIKQVKAGLIEQGMSEDAAADKIYTGGLQIHSTLDLSIQQIAEKEFANNANFPTGTSAKKDKAGNIVDSSGRVMLYLYSNFFDDEGSFLIPKDDYSRRGSDLVLHAGGRLSFYKTKNPDGSNEITIDLKKTYIIEDKILHSYNGGALIGVDAKYKTLDEDKNLVIDGDFLAENPEYFSSGADGVLKVGKGFYQLRQKVVQPQGAMVIIDQRTGQIKTMVGGRGIEGRMLFNRAVNPNPPGSSIKPIAVYAPALAAGMTAATVVDDCETVVNGRVWPANHNHRFEGIVSMRRAVQQSINVAAVKFQQEVGNEASVKMLKDMGVTTLVETGATNDMNPSALALGGMTKGIPPLEMAGAYASIANDGEYIEPKSFTTVTDRQGNVILEANSVKHKAMDQDVAYVMTHILKSVVTEGLGGRASIGAIPVAGKTGTTSNNYDAWFCGFTPYYTAALWIGNDIDIDMREGSTRAAQLWSKIMKQAHTGLSGKTFSGHSKNITNVEIDKISGKLPTELSRQDPRGTVRTEIFIKGTQPTEPDDFHVAADVCNASKLLATPYCPDHQSGVYVKRPEDWKTGKAEDASYNVPVYYCNLHNPDPNAYPIPPGSNLSVYTPPPEDPFTDPNTDLDLDGTGESDGSSNSGSNAPGEDNTNPEWDPFLFE